MDASLGEKKLILVIEDDLLTRSLLEKFIENKGYRVLSASTGDDGIKMARQFSPDLILCDVTMPGMSGLTVLQTLKSDPDLQSTPFLMCTAENSVDQIKKCSDLGADGYVLKPFDFETLLSKVRSCLSQGNSSPAGGSGS